MQGIGARTDGEEVFGFLAVASASTATPISLFTKTGAGRTLLATETIKITGITGSVHTAATLSLLASASSAIPLFKAECLAATPFAAEFGPGRFCTVGIPPLVKGPTGQTYLQFQGEILQTQNAESA